MKGKNIIITGANRGIGKVLVEMFAKAGTNVWACMRKESESFIMWKAELERVHNVWIKLVYFDITDGESLNIGIKKILDENLKIDILINNAAISKDEDIYEKSGKDFLSVLETNVVGTFLVTKYALPKMSEKGVIINISSNNSLDNFNPISIDYDASKAGVNMLTKDFAVVTDRKVVAYAPGWISTSEVINMNQDFLRVEMEKVGQEKLIDPEDLVKYIISDVEKRESGEIVEVKNL